MISREGQRKYRRGPATKERKSAPKSQAGLWEVGMKNKKEGERCEGRRERT